MSHMRRIEAVQDARQGHTSICVLAGCGSACFGDRNIEYQRRCKVFSHITWF